MKTKKLLLSLSVLACSCLLVGGVGVAKESASADTAVANTPASVAFQMEQGAAVRVSSNSAENGIRYQVTMPATEYAALEANTAYQSVSYGILIAPNTYHTENALNEENVFGETPKYDWAIKNQDGEWVYSGQNGKNDSPKRIMNFETDVLSTWSKDTSKKTYFASITDINEVNLPRDFVGVAYIKYTLANGTTDYVFVQENDNMRSMSQVARAAFNDAESELTSTQKTDLKKAYIDDVYGNSFEFDKDTEAYFAKSGEGVAIVEDDVVDGVTCLQGTFTQPDNVNTTDTHTDRTDFRIDLGGEYKIKDIQKIVIKYRVVKSTEANWWRTFLNDSTKEGQEVKNDHGVSFSGGSGNMGRDGEPINYYATMTIVPTETVEHVGTIDKGLTGEDYLYAISFGHRGQSYRSTTINIASIIVYTGFEEKYLDFNETAALGVVEEGYNTEIVDLGNGNKALQATICQWYSDQARNNLKINVGGKYKVSEIEKVEISWKVLSVSGSTSAAQYWVINLNATGSYTSVSYDNRLTGLGTTVFQPTSGFNKITLTDAGAAACSLTGNTIGGTLLSQEDYLENLFFYSSGEGSERIATLQIDYIKITLKS